jgi:hypothetical protein
MEELATNRIVPQPGGRLGGREICAPICGRLGTINASFLKADPGVSDALRSWIKNVVAPALVKAYVAEQALRKGEAHA